MDINDNIQRKEKGRMVYNLFLATLLTDFYFSVFSYMRIQQLDSRSSAQRTRSSCSGW